MSTVLSLLGPTTANAIETPTYTLIETLLNESGIVIELRDYAPQIQAVTTLGYGDGGFGTLAGYIFGGNKRDESIAMTAPVATQQSTAGMQMAFTMPSNYTLESLPEPNSSQVSFQQVPQRLMGVIVFSGRTTSSRIAELNARLLAELAAKGWVTSGSAILNRYDPPWTLPPFRTNEIQYQVTAEQNSISPKLTLSDNPEIKGNTIF